MYKRDATSCDLDQEETHVFEYISTESPASIKYLVSAIDDGQAEKAAAPNESHAASRCHSCCDSQNVNVDSINDAAAISSGRGDTPGDSAVKRKGLWSRVSPWICVPNTKKKWITFCCFWTVVGGGTAYLILLGFTKFVDHVVAPTTELAEHNLNQWQLTLVLSACIVILPLVFIPPLPFIWVTAMIFNMWIAFAIVQATVMASMALGYAVARRYMYKRASKFLDRYRHIKAVLLAVDEAGPFRVALFVRLGPLPFTVENYVMAVPPSLTFLPYMAGSTLGQLPGNLLGVYFGKNIKGLGAMMKGEKTSAGQKAYNIGGLLVSVILVVLGFWYAKRSLRRIEREAAEAKAAASANREEAESEGEQQEAKSAEALGERAIEPGLQAQGNTSERVKAGQPSAAKRVKSTRLGVVPLWPSAPPAMELGAACRRRSLSEPQIPATAEDGYGVTVGKEGLGAAGNPNNGCWAVRTSSNSGMALPLVRPSIEWPYGEPTRCAAAGATRSGPNGAAGLVSAGRPSEGVSDGAWDRNSQPGREPTPPSNRRVSQLKDARAGSTGGGAPPAAASAQAQSIAPLQALPCVNWSNGLYASGLGTGPAGSGGSRRPSYDASPRTAQRTHSIASTGMVALAVGDLVEYDRFEEQEWMNADEVTRGQCGSGMMEAPPSPGLAGPGPSLLPQSHSMSLGRELSVRRGAALPNAPQGCNGAVDGISAAAMRPPSRHRLGGNAVPALVSALVAGADSAGVLASPQRVIGSARSQSFGVRLGQAGSPMFASISMGPNQLTGPGSMIDERRHSLSAGGAAAPGAHYEDEPELPHTPTRRSPMTSAAAVVVRASAGNLDGCKDSGGIRSGGTAGDPAAPVVANVGMPTSYLPPIAPQKARSKLGV